MKAPAHVFCTACNRVVYVTDVDEHGRCVLCVRTPAPRVPEPAEKPRRRARQEADDV